MGGKNIRGRGRMAITLVVVLATGGLAGQALADSEHSSAPEGSCPKADPAWKLTDASLYPAGDATDHNGNGLVSFKTTGNPIGNIVDDTSHQKPKP